MGINDTNPAYNLDVAGTLKTDFGRWPTGTQYANTVQEDTIFDALSPSIPNTSDVVLITGFIEHDTELQAIAYATRTDAANISFRGGNTVTGNQSAITITDGNADTIDNIIMAW